MRTNKMASDKGQATATEAEVARRLEALTNASARLVAAIDGLVTELLPALRSGEPIWTAGNGGASGLASHFASDLREATPWSASPICSLAADADTLTALANDWGFDEVFARQVARFNGGLLLLLSTSGQSRNCVLAAKAAQHTRCVALVGAEDSDLAAAVDRALVLELSDVQAAQEAMLLTLHAVVDQCRR